MTDKLSADDLRLFVQYDSATGMFVWHPRKSHLFVDGGKSAAHQCNAWNARHAGRPAFTSCTNGYLAGRIWGVHIYAHRAAWAHSFGVWPDVIDHINGNKTDNRICNLRDCDLSGNARNAIGKGGSSAFKGVSIDTRSNRWIANIRAGGAPRYIGAFLTEEAAARAYDAVAIRLHGEFARLNFPEGAST